MADLKMMAQALRDPNYLGDVRRGTTGAINRGLVGSLIGAPVDIASMAIGALGFPVKTPVMGSEWIGQKMQQAGMVGDERNPIAEGLAGLVDPATAAPMAMKAAAYGAPLVAALGATAIGSKASEGAQSSKLANALRGERGSLFKTEGLPNRGSDLIRSKAEEYAKLLKDAGVDVLDIQHSGSAAGPSSYISVLGQPDLRISGHSKGVSNSQGIINVSDENFQEILSKLPKTVRKATPEDYARLKQQEIDTMYPIRIKSAQKKIAKGRPLTISEQEAIDWLNSQQN